MKQLNHCLRGLNCCLCDSALHIPYNRGERDDFEELPEINICSERNERVSVRVDAAFRRDGICFNCQDLGPAVEEYFGDSDYEYWYRFDRENSGRLMVALSEGRYGAYEEMKYLFGGMEGMKKLREYCAERNIEYSFFSY